MVFGNAINMKSALKKDNGHQIINYFDQSMKKQQTKIKKQQQ